MSKLLLNQLAGTNMAYNRFSFDYFLDSMQRLGIRNIELYGCSTHLHPYDGGDPIPLVRKKLRDAGLRVVSMMPEQNVYPVNLAAAEKAVREHTVEVYKWFIQAAAELGAHQMLLCPGRPYRDRPLSEGYKYSIDSVLRLLDTARDAGVVLCYETLRIGESTLTANLRDTCRVVEELNDPYLACCVDTVPVYCAGEWTEDYFAALGKKIHHFHLNDGAPDGHLIWGDGTQNLDEHLNALRKHGYSRYITMEMAAAKYKADPEPYYRRNIEVLKAHFDGGTLDCSDGWEVAE